MVVYRNARLVIGTIATIIKALEIQKLNGGSNNFGRLIFNASYNLFFLSIFTSTFTSISEEVNHRENIAEHHLNERERGESTQSAKYDTMNAKTYPDLEHVNTQTSSVT